MTSTRMRLVVAAACLIALTGCTAGGGEPDPETVEAAPAAEDGADEGGDAGTVSGAGVEDFDADDVIVSQEVAVPSSPEDIATIGIHSLTVEGDVQVLRLVITPHFESKGASDTVNVYDVFDKQKFWPQLVDMENLKVYSPVSETAQAWASDAVYTKTINDEPMVVWAVFAAPEDDNETFDVRLLDSWPAFTDVPVTR